jgi:secreted trypsin-like serine protease
MLAGLLLPTAATAAPGARASIIGGTATSIAAFPSLAYVQADEGAHGSFACTGTVISPRVILTAAHCVEDLEAGGYTPADVYAVAAGVADPHEAKVAHTVLRVASTHVFPEFDPATLRGDAGILVLATPTSAPPIALATPADRALYEGGATVLLAGWGLRGPGASSQPSDLRSAATVVQDGQSCKRRIRRFYPPYSAAFQMCTLNPPTLATGTCFGDSGGPAIAQRPDGPSVEVGITSTGGPGCNTRLPDIFTRIDRVSTWASEWIAATETGAPPPTGWKTRLPLLTTENAEELTSGVLADAFGNRFLRARELWGGCKRVERQKVKCGLVWLYGRNIYYGTVTVYYASRRDAVIWDSRYRISSVNYHCWFFSRHPHRCAVKTRRR